MIHPFRRVQGGAGGAQNVNIFSGEQDTTDDMLFPTPNTLTLYDHTTAAALAGGAGTAYLTRYGSNTFASFAQTGSTVTLADPSTSVLAAVTGSFPASANATAGQSYSWRGLVTGTPAVQELQMALVYQDDADDGLSFYGLGSRNQNVASTASRFSTFGVAGVAWTATETLAHIPWPSAGTFRRVAIVYSSSTGGGDITLVLRKNTTDTAITFTLPPTAGLKTFTTDLVTTVSVVAGDLINWRHIQAAPLGSFTCVLLCGFEAEL